MVNFFRKKRKKPVDGNPPAGRAGKAVKYARYAIGEIVCCSVRNKIWVAFLLIPKNVPLGT